MKVMDGTNRRSRGVGQTLLHTSGSSVIADDARERLCIEPCVRFLPGSHDRMNLDQRWARWIQASIGAGAVDRFFIPTIQGLGRLDLRNPHEDQNIQ